MQTYSISITLPNVFLSVSVLGQINIDIYVKFAIIKSMLKMEIGLERLFERIRRYINAEREKEEPLFQLEIGDISNILDIENKEIIDTTFETVKILQEKLKDTTSVIDSKATNLFGMVSISVSLITYFASTILEETKIGLLFYILILLFITVIFLMITSNILSLRAFRARSDWREIKDTDVFREEMIKSEARLHKIFLITAFWQIYIRNYQINEEKGKELKRAQKYLAWALFLLLPIFIFLIINIELQGGR